MQCKEVAVVLEQEGWTPLPEAAREHVAGCGSCQSLVEDLTEIVATAHLLPAEVEPPARVWFSLKAQLEQEGIIKPPVLATEKVLFWAGFQDLFRSRVLATGVVGLLVIAALTLQLQHPATPQIEAHNFFDDTAIALNADEASLNQANLSSEPVDISLHQNLDIVDKFIADCEQRIKDEPDDDLTREYLTGAYEQKAELISAMMERRGSVN
ncbi:MAG: hypothetical protein JO260_00560 [Acidobacteria bacterium]|nr:hypothetical protein [Acidobacteriota bacterium]